MVLDRARCYFLTVTGTTTSVAATVFFSSNLPDIPNLPLITLVVVLRALTRIRSLRHRGSPG